MQVILLVQIEIFSMIWVSEYKKRKRFLGNSNSIVSKLTGLKNGMISSQPTTFYVKKNRQYCINYSFFQISAEIYNSVWSGFSVASEVSASKNFSNPSKVRSPL